MKILIPLIKKGVPDNFEKTKSGTSSGKRAGFKCLLSGTPLTYEYLRSEGEAGRMGTKLMAIVAEGNRERVYLSPNPEQENLANEIPPVWSPENLLPNNPRNYNTPKYGLKKYGDLFSARQNYILTTLSNLIEKVYLEIVNDGEKLFCKNEKLDFTTNEELKDYAKCICTYLALSVSTWADLSNSICSWNTTNHNINHLFNRQALPKTWDFAELSPFSNVGPWISTIDSILNSLENYPHKRREYLLLQMLLISK